MRDGIISYPELAFSFIRGLGKQFDFYFSFIRALGLYFPLIIFTSEASDEQLFSPNGYQSP